MNMDSMVGNMFEKGLNDLKLIAEASAKVRTGPPKDDAADLQLPIWAGLLPLETSGGPPAPSPDLLQGIAVPAHVAQPRRP